jgi:FKBP-type peptidyl-prolyl cis-trans isomerase
MKKCILILLLFVSAATFAQKDTIYAEGGVKYVSTQVGTDDIKPQVGQEVKIRYVGKLLDGTVFDEVTGRAFFTFKIGDKDIIQGWSDGFKLMSKGEKGIFIIPPFLAYGSKGFKDPYEPTQYMIPPNATLIFEVELISIK